MKRRIRAGAIGSLFAIGFPALALSNRGAGVSDFFAKPAQVLIAPSQLTLLVTGLLAVIAWLLVRLYWQRRETAYARRELGERERAEERGAAALRYNQLLLEALPIGIITYRATGEVVSANSAIARIIGATREQVVAQNFWQLESWKRSGFLASAQVALTSAQPQELEAHHHSTFGKNVWLCCQFIPFQHEGEPHLLGLFVDITERKRAEAELRESEERFRQLTENIHEVFRLQEANSKQLLYVSPAYELIWRRTCESLYASPQAWFETIHPDDRERVLQAAGELSQGVHDEQYRIVRPDGTIRWIRDRAFPIRNAAGEIYRIAGVAEDVTARYQAESALHSRVLLEERLSRLAATVPGTIFSFQLRPDGTSCLPYASPKLEEMFGVKPEEVANDAGPLFSRVQPEDLSRLHASIQLSAQTMTPWTFSVRAQLPPRGCLWIEGSSIPHTEPDGSILWHGFLLDITERKRAEAELAKAYEQLVVASRRAGMAEVATGLLHNVGNVLNSVNVSANLLTKLIGKSRCSDLGRVVALLRDHTADLGTFLTADPKGRQVPEFLSQLTERLAEERSSELAELDLLRKNVAHIKEIVASQQKSARGPGTREAVNLTDLLEDALRINDGLLSGRNLQVIREFAEVPPVASERHKVLQILVNLVRNAAQACDGSGQKANCLTLRLRNSGGCVKISVSDTGAGIAPEHFQRLFQHGFTTKQNGHGFGLHSGALAAKELGGSLIASSDGPGLGATFTLELPINPDVLKPAADSPRLA